MSEAAKVEIRAYKDETDLPDIISMIAADLSEPYSIYVYRYFIHQWPELCFVVSLSIHMRHGPLMKDRLALGASSSAQSSASWNCTARR